MKTKADIGLLENWASLNNKIMELPEAELKRLLAAEKDGQNRMQFLLRIYGRYNTLRTVRERRELVSQ